MVRVFLADAHWLTLKGLSDLLEGMDGVSICGTAFNATELIEAIGNMQAPDVLILDYAQPGSFSPGIIHDLKHLVPGTKILVISADQNRQTIQRVLQEGIQQFITKTCDEKEVRQALEAAIKGEQFFCNRVLDYISAIEAHGPVNCLPTPLTARERDIVVLVAEGLLSKEIADRLQLSQHTVNTHRKNILKKLKLGTTGELVRYAIAHGLTQTELTTPY